LTTVVKVVSTTLDVDGITVEVVCGSAVEVAILVLTCVVKTLSTVFELDVDT
jgi:hypothetical protein